ncbi:hypothetical protein [Spirosoma flavum]|uniref:Uncharacterized protein n=1 Tax=Spirosoma flavum TaxID=2048557 RepID=A0ABW6AP93_9BACT
MFEFPPIPIDPSKGIFGPLYEGSNKYHLLVQRQPDLTSDQIKMLRYYVDLVKNHLSEEDYTESLLKAHDEFVYSAVEDSSITAVLQLAQWMMYYMYEKRDYKDEVYGRGEVKLEFDEPEQKETKGIVIGLQENHLYTYGGVRKLVRENSDLFQKWLDAAIERANYNLMSKQIGEMTGYEFKKYLTYIGGAITVPPANANAPAGIVDPISQP